MSRVVAALVLAVCACQGQGFQFEVASVKRQGGWDGERRLGFRGGPGTADPDRITWEGTSLLAIVARAYGVQFAQIVGPDWLSADQYVFQVKLPAGTTKEQLPEMWRHLLEERFHIAVRHEKKDMPVYELTVAKGGPRLKLSAGDVGKAVAGGPRAVPDDKGFPVLPPGVRNTVFQPMEDGERVVRETFRDFSMDDLTKSLAWPLGNPVWEHAISTAFVVDRTGLTGKYDFTLEFSGLNYPGGAFPAPREDGAPRRFPTLFEAVERQLGLKLRETKAPMDVLVVDRVDRVPSEN
jgi:uncharacterized protein (TIGR03435 family)